MRLSSVRRVPSKLSISEVVSSLYLSGQKSCGNCNINLLFDNMMSSLCSIRPIRTARLAYPLLRPSRTFSSIPSLRQDNLNNNSNNARTTHFGFKTVEESEKEARGMPESSHKLKIADFLSGSCILLSGFLLRYDE